VDHAKALAKVQHRLREKNPQRESDKTQMPSEEKKEGGNKARVNNIAGTQCPRSDRGGRAFASSLQNQPEQTQAANGAADAGGPHGADRGASNDAAGARPRVEVVHVFAPAGYLGVTVDFDECRGIIYVSDVSESSPLRGTLRPRDVVVALDDEDVRDFGVGHLTRMLVRKSANALRKISVLRKAEMERPAVRAKDLDLEMNSKDASKVTSDEVLPDGSAQQDDDESDHNESDDDESDDDEFGALVYQSSRTAELRSKVPAECLSMQTGPTEKDDNPAPTKKMCARRGHEWRENEKESPTTTSPMTTSSGLWFTSLVARQN